MPITYHGPMKHGRSTWVAVFSGGIFMGVTEHPVSRNAENTAVKISFIIAEP